MGARSPEPESQSAIPPVEAPRGHALALDLMRVAPRPQAGRVTPGRGRAAAMAQEARQGQPSRPHLASRPGRGFDSGLGYSADRQTVRGGWGREGK